MFERFMGLDVHISDNLPKEEIGTHIYWAHPFVQWLSKFIRIRPYVIGGSIYEEQLCIIGNRIFMSRAMYDTLRREDIKNAFVSIGVT